MFLLLKFLNRIEIKFDFVLLNEAISLVNFAVALLYNALLKRII